MIIPDCVPVEISVKCMNLNLADTIFSAWAAGVKFVLWYFMNRSVSGYTSETLPVTVLWLNVGCICDTILWILATLGVITKLLHDALTISARTELVRTELYQVEPSQTELPRTGL